MAFKKSYRNNNLIKRATIYCASSSAVDERYLTAAEELGRELARKGIEIIYGGGSVGMMGRAADGSVSEDGKVIGVIPKFMMDLELGHLGLSELRIVDDMHERQSIMAVETDCIIVMPGGCGTLLELFEAISWKKLGLISSPIIIVNLSGYFDPVLEMLDRCISEKFMKPEQRQIWKTCATIEETLGIVDAGQKAIERRFEVKSLI